MQWTAEGLIIGVRRHGETSVIAEVMVEGRGRHLGLVRGGRSTRMRKANSGSATAISLPAIDATPPSAITVSAKMRPAIGPGTLMCFCPAALVAAIFQPNKPPVEWLSSAAWIA